MRVKKLLDTSPTEWVLIISPENLYYFSGFTGGEGSLLLHRDHRLLFTDSRYILQAKDQSPTFTVIDVAETSPAAYLKTLAPSPIGFEEAFVTMQTFMALKKIPAEHQWMPISKRIYELRMIKDAQELACITAAAACACDAFSYILGEIAPGKTEREIALKLEFFMRERGADGLSFETIAASGARSALPHGTATEKRLERGDFFTLDFGCKWKGYCSDMTRTVVLGAASPKQKEVYNTVLSAQTAALSAISSGKNTKEIDAIARNIIEEKGYGKNFGHGLGHSLGLCIHESPSLSPKCDKILAPNTVMTVEPGIYIENFGGVRIEDLVIIKEHGIENLVTSPKHLIEL